jgi:hypothetical protein
VYGQHVRILYHKPMGCVSLIYLIQQRAFSTKIERIDLNRAETGREEDQTYIMNAITSIGTVNEVNRVVKGEMLNSAMSLMIDLLSTTKKEDTVKMNRVQQYILYINECQNRIR